MQVQRLQKDDTSFTTKIRQDMTQQDFMLKWSPIVESSTYNNALIALAFMFDVKQMVDEATKVQQNAAQGLLGTLEFIVEQSEDFPDVALAHNAINEYKEATK